MENRILIIGKARSGRSILLLMHALMQQHSELQFQGISADEAIDAMKRFTDSTKTLTKEIDLLGKVLNDWKRKPIIEKPRGVIPDKYKSRFK